MCLCVWGECMCVQKCAGWGCTCTHTPTHMQHVQEDIRNPGFSAQFPWKKISHKTGSSLFWKGWLSCKLPGSHPCSLAMLGFHIGGGDLNSDPHACTGSHLSCRCSRCSCPHPSSVASARHFICHLGIDTTVCGWQVQKNSLVDGNNLLMPCLICRYQQNKQRQISWPSCVCLDYVRAFVIDAISFLSRTMKQLNISASLKHTFKCVRPFWMQKAFQWHFGIQLVYKGPCQIFFFLSLHKSPWVLQDLEAGFIKDFCWELPRIAILSLGTAQALNINCLLGFSPSVPCTFVLIWCISGITALTNVGCRA